MPLPSPRADRRTSPLVGANRSLELVWRATQQSPGDAGHKGVSADVAGPSQRADGGSSAEPRALKAPARAERVPAAPVTSLDPGLVDRLTDDVIRRVERRLRIERERRGL